LGDDAKLLTPTFLTFSFLGSLPKSRLLFSSAVAANIQLPFPYLRA
jgi:hypothetical protein